MTAPAKKGWWASKPEAENGILMSYRKLLRSMPNMERVMVIPSKYEPYRLWPSVLVGVVGLSVVVAIAWGFHSFGGAIAGFVAALVGATSFSHAWDLWLLNQKASQRTKTLTFTIASTSKDSQFLLINGEHGGGFMDAMERHGFTYTQFVESLTEAAFEQFDPEGSDQKALVSDLQQAEAHLEVHNLRLAKVCRKQ